MPIYALDDRAPTIDPSAYVHPEAVLIGDVVLHAQANVWPKAVLRGDYGTIVVGARTSIQDGSILHATDKRPTSIGAGCVVGHNAHLEGCTIEDHCLIGSMSTVLPQAIVRTGALVGASALVSPRTEVPPRAMALGVPCRIRMDAVEEGAFERIVALYVDNAQHYARNLRRVA